jgi:hypothetical protein
MTALTMSEIHGLVTSGEWPLADLQAAMSHLTHDEVAEQYDAIMESAA